MKRAPLALVLCALACARSAASERRVDETGQYPRDITPPAGTAYPCALTALPEDLPGIPAADRSYINRTYARILRATQAKLVLLKALNDEQDVGAQSAKYRASIDKIVAASRDDSPPSGLENFHRDVISAVELQRAFFQKAGPMRTAGKSMDAVFQLPEGRDASGRLMSAWQAMAARYPAWPDNTKDSIYHHLCALDFF